MAMARLYANPSRFACEALDLQPFLNTGLSPIGAPRSQPRRRAPWPAFRALYVGKTHTVVRAESRPNPLAAVSSTHVRRFRLESPQDLAGATPVNARVPGGARLPSAVTLRPQELVHRTSTLG